MSSGPNAFEISEIQDQEIEAATPGDQNVTTLHHVEKPLDEVFADHTSLIHPRGFFTEKNLFLICHRTKSRRSWKKSHPSMFAARNSTEPSRTPVAINLRLSNTRMPSSRVQHTIAVLCSETARCAQLFRLSVMFVPKMVYRDPTHFSGNPFNREAAPAVSDVVESTPASGMKARLCGKFSVTKTLANPLTLFPLELKH